MGILISELLESEVVGRGGSFSSASSGMVSSNEEEPCPLVEVGRASSKDLRRGLNLLVLGGPNGLGGRGIAAGRTRLLDSGPGDELARDICGGVENPVEECERICERL